MAFTTKDQNADCGRPMTRLCLAGCRLVSRFCQPRRGRCSRPPRRPCSYGQDRGFDGRVGTTRRIFVADGHMRGERPA